MANFKGGTPTTTLSAEELVARGYRRVSNAYGLVTRIDRADWMEVLARKLGKSIAQFYELSETEPPKISGHWAAHYRSGFSKDTHTVNPETLRLIPTSAHDPVGYVELDSTASLEPLPKSKYQEVVVQVGEQEYRIFNRPYGIILTCTRLGGWELWERWKTGECLLGGEFQDTSFSIHVNGVCIFRKPGTLLTDEKKLYKSPVAIPRPEYFEVQNNFMYRALTGEVCTRETRGHTPSGKSLTGLWVLRDLKKVYVDSDQFRYDLAERNGIHLVDNP